MEGVLGLYVALADRAQGAAGKSPDGWGASRERGHGDKQRRRLSSGVPREQGLRLLSWIPSQRHRVEYRQSTLGARGAQRDKEVSHVPLGQEL